MPSRAQFHRWTTGDLRGLPYTDHCRVLEHMLHRLLRRPALPALPRRRAPAPARAATSERPARHCQRAPGAGMAGRRGRVRQPVRVRRPDRAESLFDGARRVRAAGLSLNLICQQVPDQYLRQWLTDGAELTCLFLDPDGEAIRAREQEEEYPPGTLSSLTSLNIDLLARLRDRLPARRAGPAATGRLRRDDPVQPPLGRATGPASCSPTCPSARGVDSPDPADPGRPTPPAACTPSSSRSRRP